MKNITNHNPTCQTNVRGGLYAKELRLRSTTQLSEGSMETQNKSFLGQSSADGFLGQKTLNLQRLSKDSGGAEDE